MPKGSKKKPKSDEETFAEVSAEAYTEICEKFEAQSRVLGEAFLLIYKAGLLNEMSQQARDYIASTPWVQELFQRGEGPNLEPRLTVTEYIEHLGRIMKVPPSQMDFLTFVVKACYIITLAEKNPLVAQELRGVSSLTHAIGDLMRS